MNRLLRDKLPCFNEGNSVFNYACQQNTQNKIKSKCYYNKSRCVRAPELKVGDYVLIKQKKDNKLSTPYNKEPCKVIQIHGTAITVSKDDQILTRNISAVKKIPDYQP